MVLVYPIMPNVSNLNINYHDGLLLLSWWTEKLEIEIPKLIVIQDHRFEGWLRLSWDIQWNLSVFIPWDRSYCRRDENKSTPESEGVNRQWIYIFYTNITNLFPREYYRLERLDCDWRSRLAMIMGEKTNTIFPHTVVPQWYSN